MNLPGGPRPLLLIPSLVNALKMCSDEEIVTDF